MFSTYLSTIYHFIFLLVMTFFWMIGFPLFLFGTFFVYLGVLLLFRRSSSSYQEEIAFKRGVIFSPVNGKVKDIIKNKYNDGLTEIKIIINPWNETGIYLPISSEIQDFLLSGKKSLFRYSKNSKGNTNTNNDELHKLSLTLRNVDSDLIKMDFYRCILGSLPEIFVMPGDRGKQQANIGHFPLGGTLLLYLPDKYEILINEFEQVVAGETLLAGANAMEQIAD